MDHLGAIILGIVAVLVLFVGVIFNQVGPTLSDKGTEIDTMITNTSVTGWE